MLKVVSAKVIVTCPGRNFVILKIETAHGIADLGTSGDVPGLAVKIDEKLAEKFPYKRAFLPVNRLEDGSMHN